MEKAIQDNAGTSEQTGKRGRVKKSYGTSPENQKLEKLIQAECIDMLVALGWMVVRYNAGQLLVSHDDDKESWFVSHRIYPGRAVAGHPDIIAFKGDRYLMFEVKNSSGRLSHAQLSFMVQAQARGLSIYVVRSWTEVNNIIQSFNHSIIANNDICNDTRTADGHIA